MDYPVEFQGFPKITRYANASCIITEKIDGTNACIVIQDDEVVATQSRKRIITPEDDNFGFASWVRENEAEIVAFMGDGRHYGEWWGAGIQRSYGCKRKWFSPFNVSLFGVERDDWPTEIGLTPTPVLACCQLPELESFLAEWLRELSEFGSYTAPGRGWAAEGVMVYSHVFKGGYIKAPFDPTPKGAQGAA